MANEHSIHCPLCGNKVPPGMTRCPVCATELQRVISKYADDSTREASDFLRRDLPGAKLPQAEATCPQCGLALQGGESRCPRCGIPLSVEEALVECPECGALSPKDARSCGRCGANLRETRARTPPIPPKPSPEPSPGAPEPIPLARREVDATPVKPELPVVEEKVTKAPTPEPGLAQPAKPREAVTTVGPGRTAQTGLVNGRGAVNGTGMVNGRGAVNGTGLVNGRGAVNGTGLVNGRGAINGTGMTNGTRADAARSRPSSRSKRMVSRWQFLALLVVLIVVIPTFMYLTYSQESAPITIDGDFEDWAEVTTFGMFQNSVSDSTNVTEWGVETDESNLYLYVEARASMMAATSIDSLYLFVDSDGNASTGYLLGDIGADYKVEYDGWNGSVEGASASRYVSVNGDQLDWNGWDSSAAASATLSSNRLEGVASVPGLDGNARYVLISQTDAQGHGLSHAVREDVPLLIVRMDAGSGIAAGIAPSAPSVVALRLTFTCQGGSGSVTSVLPKVTGATLLPPQVGTMNLDPSSGGASMNIMIDTSSSPSGSVATVGLAGVSSTFDESVTIVGDEVRAYVGSAPGSIQIDGAFADWAGRTEVDTDSGVMIDANVDIDSVGAVNSSLASYFYASVKGEMCGGSFVPSLMTKPSGSSGGTVIPAKKTGEDILRVYVDTDIDVSTGSVVACAGKTIGADHLIEVRGLNGEVTSSSIMYFMAGAWTGAPGSVTAANDAQQIELSVSSSSISGASSIDFIVEMTDWRGWSDMATATPQGMDLPGTRAWVVDDTISSAQATATSNQRKLFFDGTNFWSVYVDGSDTVARWSTNGMTWTSAGRIFKTNGVVFASIWYHSATATVYAVGDSTTASANVYVQRGVVSPSTHVISWEASDRTLPVSTNAVASKNAFISRDATGYIWVMSVNCTTVVPTRYDLSTFRTAAVDSTSGAWTAAGGMLVSSTQPSLKGSIVPAGTGSNMWAVYVYQGTVSSKKYTGSWSAESILYTPSAAGLNTDDAPPCALVDSGGVLRVVYGDDHEQPVGTSKPRIWYRYNTGSAWSAAESLTGTSQNSNGYKYPTISVDASTGYLYAFWYDMQTFYVVAKRNVGGTWSTLTLHPQTTNAKAYVTSIYSAPSEAYICYQWTQNTTAPLHVIFDRIPEFSDAALPVLGTGAILAIILRPTRRRDKTA